MNGGECGFTCGFCQKTFRSLNRKLRHLKACKLVVPIRKRHVLLVVGQQ